MTLHSRPEADEFLARVAATFTPRWWDEKTETWLCGVFEGGGAKGAAYGPALRAFRDEGCWFKSAAGASAGAITAALVAAGFTPEAMAECTLEALSRLSSRSVRFQALAGWSRLRSDPPHIASNARLSELLEELLAIAVGGESGSGPVTFAQLYAASAIELYIVCVDAAGQREFVFHHELTPDAGVAAAAIASSAIPVYFPPTTLHQPDSAQARPAILFDGGVWANFPLWVYRDPSFSAYHFGLERYANEDGSAEHPYIVGVLLDETKRSDGTTATTVRGRRASVSWRLVAMLMMMLSSPIFVAAFVVAFVASTAVLGGVVFPTGHSEGTTKWWDSHRVLVTALLVAAWFCASLYQVRQLFLRIRRRQLHLDSPFQAWPFAVAEILGSLLGVVVLLLTPLLIHAGATRSSTNTIAPYLRVPLALGAIALAAIGLSLVVGAVGFVVFAGPATLMLGPWIAPTLMSAGAARYWVGTAPDDRVIRLGVEGIGTLDFAKARDFAGDAGQAIYDNTQRQLRERGLTRSDE